MERQSYNWWSIIALIWGVFCIILCLCMGCTRHVYVPVVHERVDSISVHDTLFQVQLVPYKDSVVSRDTSSYLHNEYAYSYATWSDGVLQHSLGIWPQKPIEIEVPYFIDRWHYEKVPEIVEVEKPLSKWTKLLIYIGGGTVGTLACAIIGLMIYLIFKFKNPFKEFFT